MTVFKTYFRVVKKHLGNLFMYTGIFMVIVFMFSQSASSNTVESFQSSAVNIAIYDHDQSQLSKALYNYLAEMHNVQDLEEDLDKIRDSMYQRDVEYVLVIPEGFAADHKAEAYKLPGSISSQFLDMNINTFVDTYTGYLTLGLSEQDAYEKTVETIAVKTQVEIHNQEAAPNYGKSHSYFMYIPYVLVSVVILSIGPVLYIFNKEEIRKRTYCSKVSASSRVVSLVTGSCVLALAIVIFYSIFSIVLYGNELTIDTALWRFLNIGTYGLVCVAFAVLFSMMIKSTTMLNMFTNVLGLGSSFLCGVFVPREYLSEGVKAVGKFLPAYWYVNVEDEICKFAGTVTEEMWIGYGVQLLYGAAVLSIALVVSQLKRRK